MSDIGPIPFPANWDDLSRKDKLSLMDVINKHLAEIARLTEDQFNVLFREINAPLEVYATAYLSVTDNLRDPRLPEH